jgi:putative endonuclease
MFEFLKVSVGQFFEDRAVDFLKLEGFEILCTRFRCRSGEIDIVARNGDVLSFIEVRARRSGSIFEPIESVDRRKITRIKKTAQYFLRKNPYLNELQIRFDLFIYVFDGKNMRIIIQEHLPDFFR